MKINKILNNNYVVSSSEEMGEVVIMGPGVGFRKKAGDDIDNRRIEKTFCITTGKDTDTINPIHFKLARNIVKKAKKAYHVQFYEEVVGMIANYLSFIMKSKEQKRKLFQRKSVENKMNDFETEAVSYVKEKTNIELTATEARYISDCLICYLKIDKF